MNLNSSIYPLRKVMTFEWGVASRYTGYVSKSKIFKLECGHEVFRKDSQGLPQKIRCRDSWMKEKGHIL